MEPLYIQHSLGYGTVPIRQRMVKMEDENMKCSRCKRKLELDEKVMVMVPQQLHGFGVWCEDCCNAYNAREDTRSVAVASSTVTRTGFVNPFGKESTWRFWRERHEEAREVFG